MPFVRPNDMLIAAHALSLGLVLVTDNVREFEIVADSDRREREAERPARPARVLSARRRHRAAATGSRSSSVQTGRASVAPVRFAEVGRAGE